MKFSILISLLLSSVCSAQYPINIEQSIKIASRSTDPLTNYNQLINKPNQIPSNPLDYNYVLMTYKLCFQNPSCGYTIFTSCSSIFYGSGHLSWITPGVESDIHDPCYAMNYVKWDFPILTLGIISESFETDCANIFPGESAQAQNCRAACLTLKTDYRNAWNAYFYGFETNFQAYFNQKCADPTITCATLLNQLDDAYWLTYNYINDLNEYYDEAWYNLSVSCN